jgi:hypothetical protein
VGGRVDAGVVERFALFYDHDTQRLTVDHRSPLIQGRAVPGAAEAGDRFGEVLATDQGSLGLLYVGVPHEDVGSARDAGMVSVYPRAATAQDLNVTQNTPGLPGTAEAGDQFGAALFGRLCEVLVGAPGEDVGDARDAGLAQLFSVRPCSAADVDAGVVRTQASPGIPGSPETGDRFGAAVAVTEVGSSGRYLVIGAPGEDIGDVRDAGAVHRENYCHDDHCPAVLEYQGHGLPGSPEAGDQAGAALTLRNTTPDESDVPSRAIDVAVPGEDVGTGVDAGVLYLDYVRAPVAVGPPGGPVAGLRYGAVLAPLRPV